MLCGRYLAAERLYRFTLSIRRALPLIGKTARVDFWNLSLANCYRETDRFADAESAYKSVIEHQQQLSGLDALAQKGLLSVARNNYAILLDQLGRTAEAAVQRQQAGWQADYMILKYAIAGVVVLFGGLFFAFWLHLQFTISH